MDAYIVTGAAGFIGSNIVQALAQTGHHYLIAVDDLETVSYTHLTLPTSDLV